MGDALGNVVTHDPIVIYAMGVYLAVGVHKVVSIRKYILPP